MKKLLFNPFEKYPDKTLLCFGLLSSFIGGFVGYLFNARFDGVFDLHFVEQVPIHQTIAEIAIGICCSTVLLFTVGKISNKKTRIIDLLSTTMIARIPFYLLTFFNANNLMYNRSQSIMTIIKSGKTNSISSWDLVIVLIFAMSTLLFLIWYIALLFNGFKVATNAKGTKPTLFFIVAMITAEIVSKIFISEFL